MGGKPGKQTDGAETKCRFPSMSEDDIDELVASKQTKGTSKMTTWSVRQFKSWLSLRQFSVEFEMLPTNQLDDILRRFYAEVRTADGKMYSRSSYSGIRGAAINRHIRSPPYNRAISLTDKEFHKSGQVFQATLKKMSREGLDVSEHHQSVSEGDLKKLRQCPLFNAHNPQALQSKVWFELTLSFARRGCENIQTLKKDAFVITKDDISREYAEMRYNEQIKNHQGDTVEPTTNMTSKPRMHASKFENSPSCPIKALKLYLSKLNPESDRLFQQPKQKFDVNSSTWYTTRPVGSKTIAGFMAHLSSEANLSRRYTNHCVRAPTVTKLSHAGVPSRAIARITKHRNVKSLENYETDSSAAQKRHYSDILLQENDDSLESANVCVGSTNMSIQAPPSNVPTQAGPTGMSIPPGPTCRSKPQSTWTYGPSTVNPQNSQIGHGQNTVCTSCAEKSVQASPSTMSIPTGPTCRPVATRMFCLPDSSQSRTSQGPLLPLNTNTNVTNVLHNQMPQFMNPFNFSGCNVTIENHYH